MSTNAADVPWLSGDEARAWRSFRRMKALLDLQLARDLGRDSGLSEPDYDVLSTLTEREEPWRMSDLAGRLLWSTSRLAHHVKRMEARGLVRREPSGDDARGAVLGLTPHGRAVLGSAAPLHVRRVRERFVDVLTPEEISCLAVLSAKVVEHLGAPPEGLR